MTPSSTSRTIDATTSETDPAAVVPAATGSADSDNDAVVLLEDVRFQYGSGPTVLDGITMTVNRGQIVGVVGPSGCGKSTLLSILASLSAPTSGTIEHRLARVPGRHSLSMVFQKDTLLPWLNVADNVALGFRLHRTDVSRSERRSRVQELISMVGLEGFEKHYPYQLSGGMKRRVAFLAAVAPLPQVLLLDEPFSSLDEPTRVAIHQDILRIMHEFDMSAILVTHDLAEAVALCNEVNILTARPASVYSKHKVDFGRERVMLELRQDPDFLDLYGTLWHDLSLQIVKSHNAGDNTRSTQAEED